MKRNTRLPKVVNKPSPLEGEGQGEGFFSRGLFMKILLSVIFMWALTLSAVWAQADLKPDQQWIEQIDGSFALPSVSTIEISNPGYGGDINVGYRFDHTWALFFGLGYYQYNIATLTDAVSSQLNYIPLTLFIRMTLCEGPFHPFLFAGAGAVINIFSQTFPAGDPIHTVNQSEIDPYLGPGVGVLYRFEDDMAAFVQTRIDVNFTSFTGLGIPMANPSIFIPIQAGISFFVL